MSPHSPMSFSTPTAPAVYTWEATNEAVAEKFGVPVEQIIRFDLNTSPTPPELVATILAANRFETSLSEYPPSDYRRLSAAAADTYGVARSEILVGAGADEILDMSAKAFLAPGRTAVVPIPTYSMYRVVSEQRGATVVAVPRLGPDDGWAIDVPAMRAAGRTASLIWLCSPNNPTGRPEPAGAVESLLAGLAADAADDGRTPPAVILDEAYAEFAGTSLVPLIRTYPRFVVVRTASKAYAMAGLRVGFALAPREVLELIEPYRPPGSVSTVSVTVVTEVLRDPETLRANVERVDRERTRLAEALGDLGWQVQPSVTNFLLVQFGTAVRSEWMANGFLRRGLVPRTFPSGAPARLVPAVHRSRAPENDRLIRAAQEIAAEEAAA